jgi:hypothetical protein
MSSSSNDAGWWWCLKHNTVEGPDGCAAKHRIGPFETREEAARALDIIREREERKRAEDAEWNDK